MRNNSGLKDPWVSQSYERKGGMEPSAHCLNLAVLLNLIAGIKYARGPAPSELSSGTMSSHRPKLVMKSGQHQIPSLLIAPRHAPGSQARESRAGIRRHCHQPLLDLRL